MKHGDKIQPFVGAVGIVLLLVLGEGESVEQVLPLAVIFVGIAVSRSLDDRSVGGPPLGPVVVGSSFVIAGVYYFVVIAQVPGYLCLAIGGWFILDGVTTFRSRKEAN